MKRSLSAGALAILIVFAASGTAPAEEQTNQGKSTSREIKRFDFDEQRLGNFELAPMNWQSFVATRFPPYLRAKLDPAVGHDAPPSMRLPLSIGSVGVTYNGEDIPIRIPGDYRVSAWVKPDRLAAARAYISACFLDGSMS